MRGQRSGTVVAFDLTAEDPGDGYLVSGHDTDLELDPVVHRRREDLLRALRGQDHGWAAEGLALPDPHRTAREQVPLSALLVSTRLAGAAVVPQRDARFEVVPAGPDERTSLYVGDLPAAARRREARRLLDHGRTDAPAVLVRVRELGHAVGDTRHRSGDADSSRPKLPPGTPG